MRPIARVLVFALAGALLCSAALLRAQDEPEAEGPPAAGRPENFSHVVGTYRLAASAVPTEVCVEDPFVLVVRITGGGPAAWRPRRERLRLFPASLEKDFFVKPLPGKDRFDEADKTWEFAYELRPRRLAVRKVPALRLIYYDPRYRRYQTAYAPALPLMVKPRPQAQPPPKSAEPRWGPEFLYDLETGPQVLRRPGTGWPGWPALAALVLGPPVLSGLGYFLWRRRHEQDSGRARQRRSVAAEQAIKALGACEGAEAGRIAAVVGNYLRQRLDLPAAEPTPREAARHLRRLGMSAALVQKTADLLRSCDAARFGPGATAGGAVPAQAAAQLILALEADPCPSCPA